MMGPLKYDYDEGAKINQSSILDRKVWVPCVPVPSPIDQYLPEHIKFKQVSCGTHHTVAVSTQGEVFSCGLSTRGRLGLLPE